jgi:ABC-2 type transport system ATP-binding protein
VAVRRRVGFLPELFRFHEWMTGRELVAFHGRLHGMQGPDLARRVEEVLDLVGLADRGGDRVGGYSKGMQQRAGLAQALVNRPEVVFLDEPTSALDPLGRLDVRAIIHHLKDAGTTVFLNSHLLGEVELTCDRVAIVTKGRVVREGRLEDLLRGKLEADLRVDRLTPELQARLAPLGRVAGSDETSAVLELASEEVLPEVAQAVHASGARLYALVPRRESLEELFVRLVRGGEEQ